MEAGVLGPLRILGPAGEIVLTGAKERTVLAHLVARVGQVVPAADMIDALWPDDPPRTSQRTLQAYIARVRGSLEQGGVGAGVIATAGRGYRLAVDPADIDSHQFARLVDLGRAAAADGQHRGAADIFVSALSLWRGGAYAGFESTLFGRAEARRLAELRLSAQEEWFAARIESGSAAAALPELEAHVTQNPLREHAWALLVRAHAAVDNQGAAFDALDRARRVLADELGVDPGGALRGLQQRVLAQDPSLRPRSSLPSPLLGPTTEMVGGSEQLATLTALWRQAGHGAGRRVVILGDGGSGRWRLACELATLAQEQGAQVVLGCDPAAATGRPVLRVVDCRLGTPIELPTTVPLELQVVVGGASPEGLVVDEVVHTVPLTVEQVGEILSGYLPGTADSEGVWNAAWDIHARTGGNAALVRESAVNWARAAVADRVAARTTANSTTSQVHDAQRSALAQDVLAWSRLRPDLEVDAGVCPWRGLASYREADTAWFSGRERFTAELVARIGAERALLLVGGSGSGKSSLLRAGLLASLVAGALPGSTGWVRIVLRPGPHPMRELTEACLSSAGATGPDRIADLLSRSLAGDGSADRILLVIDQFEECWTVCTDPGEREAFLSTVTGLAGNPEIPLTVVLAVRADHAGSIATHPGIAGVLAGRAVFVGPMVEGELRRVIEGPAGRAGLSLDVGLSDALVADTLAEPGGLPLLSTALAELWDNRDGQRLTLAAYAASGGVSAAIGRMAERAFAELDQAHQQACRVLLLRLAGPGSGDGVVRRRVALDELSALPDPLVHSCVEPLVAARLLTITDGHVEVAHEALFRSWPRLREWLAEDATAREVQRRLTAAAAEWEVEGADRVGLWTGTRLASALDLLAARPGEFTGVEADFVEASVAKADAERAETEVRAATAQRQNRRLLRLLGGLGIALAVALVASLLAVVSRNDATAQRETATAQRLAATAISEDYLAERMLTAVEAVRTEESPQTVGALLSVLAANSAIVDRIDTPNRLLGVDAGVGSGQAVAIANLEDLHVFDTVTGADRVAWSEPDANLIEVRVSPDGRYTAFLNASWSAARPPRLVVLDLESGEPVWTRDVEADPAVLVGGWDFTDVSGQLAVATAVGLDVVQVDGSAKDLRIPLDPVEPQPLIMHRADDRRMLLFAGQEVPARLIDLDTGRVEAVPQVGPWGFTSPNGRLVATQAASDSALEAGPLLIIDLTNPGADPVPIPFEGELGGTAFLPDGRTIVAGSMGGDVVVADTRSGEVREILTGGHNGAVMGVAVSPDGRTAWTAGRDGDIIAWDVSGEHRLATGRDLALAVTSGQVSADGRKAAVWAANPEGEPAQVGVLDLDSGTLASGPFALPGEPGDQPFSPAAGITPDGATLLRGAIAGPEQPARLQVIDVASGDVRHDIELPWFPNGIAASTDGAAALVAGEGGVARIDLATGRLDTQVDLPGVSGFAEVQSTVAPSPDGRHVAVARDSEIVILDVADLAMVQTWSAGEYDTVLTMQWLDAGRTLAFGGRLGRLEARSFPGGDTVIASRVAFPGFVLDMAVNPDGSLLALLGGDGEVVLWDVATGQPIGEPLEAGSDIGWGWVRFTPDGKALEALYETRRAYRFPISTESLIERACAIAAREPSAAEWASMHGDRPQRPTCGGPGQGPIAQGN